MKIRPIQEGNARLSVRGIEVASLMSQHLSVQVKLKRDKCPCCTQSVASERGTLHYSLVFSGLLALSSWGASPSIVFLDDPFLQALGLVEEKQSKQDHWYQHKGAQNHQPHIAAVGKRRCRRLLRRDHVGQVQHVAQCPACIAAANLKWRGAESEMEGARAVSSLWKMGKAV